MISLNLAWMYITDKATNWFEVVKSSSLVLHVASHPRWEAVKWFANGCFIGGTLIMINPTVASTSVVPWVVYLLANMIWFIDSAWQNNKPWFWMAAFFIVWDIVLILSRV